MKKKTLLFYEVNKGKSSVRSWFVKLKDLRAKHLIQARLDRLLSGDLGDYKFVGSGVLELRVHYGPGYRLYFSELQSGELILLLFGGVKSSQKNDIKKAKKYLVCFKEQYGD